MSTGVVSRFNEVTGENAKRDEIADVVRMTDPRFPIMEYNYRDAKGNRRKAFYYNKYMIDDLILLKKDKMVENLHKLRNSSANKTANWIKNVGKNRISPLDWEDPEEVWSRENKRIKRENAEREKRRRESEILRRQEEMEAELRRERMNPEEDMDYVSDELLRNDDVYYDF